MASSAGHRLSTHRFLMRIATDLTSLKGAPFITMPRASIHGAETPPRLSDALKSLSSAFMICFSSGIGKSIRNSNRRHTAGSMSDMLFVAASMRLAGFLSSSSCRRTVTTRFISPMSESSDLVFAMASISSRKRIPGVTRTFENAALMLLPDSPRCLPIVSARSSRYIGIPSWEAIHRAVMVFPTPGGPVKIAVEVGERPLRARTDAFSRSSSSPSTCLTIRSGRNGFSTSERWPTGRIGASPVRRDAWPNSLIGVISGTSLD
ncbi:hypothetical protein BBPC_1159 [Bifidobacterium pseudocatenulatum DSM 20438 = JCM 1200 = LMG 10505]|nr:hypothetical protein BBPC_1159 [Bifidobacterium pseudocatenulatum DSM 20438 = JCM 1200 = LMG 10505]